jgi:hypothetical protein
MKSGARNARNARNIALTLCSIVASLARWAYTQHRVSITVATKYPPTAEPGTNISFVYIYTKIFYLM